MTGTGTNIAPQSAPATTGPSARHRRGEGSSAGRLRRWTDSDVRVPSPLPVPQGHDGAAVEWPLHPSPGQSSAPFAEAGADARSPRAVLATLAALAFAAGLATPPAAKAEDEGSKVYRKVLPSTVWIIAGTTTGTGSLIDGQNRLVLTNQHVVDDKGTVEVLFPVVRGNEVVAERAHYLRQGKRVKGRVVHRDTKRDLAIVQLDELPRGTPVLPVAAQSAAPGARVHSIGNPSVSGALWVYTSGSVRQVYRRSFKLRDGREIEARVVETQSPINSGDSGGPVVNDAGELVAVVQSYEGRDARLVSTFIDVSEVKAVLEAFSRRAGTTPGTVEAPATPKVVENPAVRPVPNVPAPATPASAVSARVNAVRQEHNVEVNGRRGIALKIDFEVHRGRGVAGELVAVFHDRNGNPLKARNPAVGNAAGELCSFQRLQPGYDSTVYRDVSLFMPYEELGVGSGKTEMRFSVNVWADGRWVADKWTWGAFQLTLGN